MTVQGSLTDLLPSEAFASPSDAPEVARGGRAPDVIVRPMSTTEVATVMGWARREGVGVLPIGSGRRADPVFGSDRYVGLSTDRLTGIEVYEPADLTFTARAGTRFSAVSSVLGEHAQWIPIDPPFAPERSLGGLPQERHTPQ